MKRIVALLVMLVLFLSMAPSAQAYEAPVTSATRLPAPFFSIESSFSIIAVFYRKLQHPNSRFSARLSKETVNIDLPFLPAQKSGAHTLSDIRPFHRCYLIFLPRRYTAAPGIFE